MWRAGELEPSWYCETCRAVSYERRKGAQAAHGHEKTRQQRGYGADHDRLRKRWVQRVKAGGVICGYCGGPILPGEEFDLSHPGDNKSAEPVPWHRSENRRYAASVTAPRRRGNQPRWAPPIGNRKHVSELPPESSEPPAIGGVHRLQESDPAPEPPRPGVVYVNCLKCGQSEPLTREPHKCGYREIVDAPFFARPSVLAPPSSMSYQP